MKFRKVYQKSTQKVDTPATQNVSQIERTASDALAELPRFRSRTFFIRCYADESIWSEYVRGADYFAYIKHTDETPHYHIVMQFENARSSTAVFKGMKLDTLVRDYNVSIEQPVSICSACQYLLHLTPQAVKDGKKEYLIEDVKTNDSGRFKTYIDALDNTDYESKHKNSEFLDDLVSLSREQLALKYGRDYIRNENKYLEFARGLATERLERAIWANQTAWLHSNELKRHCLELCENLALAIKAYGEKLSQERCGDRDALVYACNCEITNELYHIVQNVTNVSYDSVIFGGKKK